MTYIPDYADTPDEADAYLADREWALIEAADERTEALDDAREDYLAERWNR